jgi:hypothetical protein
MCLSGQVSLSVQSNWVGHNQSVKAPHEFEITRNKKAVWIYNDHTTIKTMSSIQLLNVPGNAITCEILH